MYVVAIADLGTKENKIHIVNVTDPIQAICVVNGDSIEEFEGLTLEEVIEEHKKVGVLVSEPVEI